MTCSSKCREPMGSLNFYLTNPTTRIIYDRFGVQGIKVYEMYSEEFREFSEEMRTQDLEEVKKKELESVSIK